RRARPPRAACTGETKSVGASVARFRRAERGGTGGARAAASRTPVLRRCPSIDGVGGLGLLGGDVGRRLGAAARAVVDAFLELLADLEEGQALRLDGHGRAGAGVAAFVGAVGADLEAAEAPDLDALAAAQGGFHRIEDDVHEELGPPL